MDEEAEEVTSGLASLEINFSNGLFSSGNSSLRHNVCEPSHHNNPSTSNPSNYNNQDNSSNFRYSYRPTNRTSFFQALSASIGNGDASTNPSTSNTHRNSRDQNPASLLQFLGILKF